MTLFHVSENSAITKFKPRPSPYTDKPVVWAVDEAHLHNYLFPRECPRITFYALPHSTTEDVKSYLGASGAVAAIEEKWLPAIKACTLTIYHLPAAGFRIQDKGAGYWVCEKNILPQGTNSVTNCLTALAKRQVEIRILAELWTLRDAILESTLQFSFIRMRNAQPRENLA